MSVLAQTLIADKNKEIDHLSAEVERLREELQARRDTPTGGGAMGGAMHAQLQALVRR